MQKEKLISILTKEGYDKNLLSELTSKELIRIFILNLVLNSTIRI